METRKASPQDLKKTSTTQSTEHAGKTGVFPFAHRQVLP